MREQCGACGGVRWRPICVKGPSEKKISCLACIYALHMVLIWHTYLLFLHNPISSLCLSRFSSINSGCNFLSSQMHYCKLIFSLKMSSYFAFVLMIANQLKSLGNLVRCMNRSQNIFIQFTKKRKKLDYRQKVRDTVLYLGTGKN